MFPVAIAVFFVTFLSDRNSANEVETDSSDPNVVYGATLFFLSLSAFMFFFFVFASSRTMEVSLITMDQTTPHQTSFASMHVVFFSYSYTGC